MNLTGNPAYQNMVRSTLAGQAGADPSAPGLAAPVAPRSVPSPDFAPAVQPMVAPMVAPMNAAASPPPAAPWLPQTVNDAVRARLNPQVGQQRMFPNGRLGKWDGKGWVHVGG